MLMMPLALLALAGPLPNQEVTEDASFTGQGTLPEDWFGAATALCGRRVLVGAPRERHGGHTGAGAAYLFERAADGSWMEVQRVRAQDSTAHDEFGAAVDLHGGWALVGAPFKDGSGTWAGAAYMYKRTDTGSFLQKAKLVPLDSTEGQQFGTSLALLQPGDAAVVGAPHDSEVHFLTGAAYVFERTSNGVWSQTAKLVPGDAATYQRFGSAISAFGDRLLVGAPGDDTAALAAGAAYVFEREQDGSWSERGKLLAGDGQEDDRFGAAVALEGDLALVGAHGDDDLAWQAGAAYVYQRGTTGSWVEVQKLHASTGGSEDRFGSEVAVSAGRAVVSAPWQGTQHGRVYLFERVLGGAWVLAKELVPSDPDAYAEFASGVSLSGDRVVAGQPRKGGPSLPGSGYAYEVGVGDSGCPGTLTSIGAPAVLSTLGSASIAENELFLSAAPVPPIAGIFFLGTNALDLPFGNGTLCVGGTIVRLGFTLPTAGVLTTRVDLTAASLAGLVAPDALLHAQAWFRDTDAGGAYFDTSSSAVIRLEP